MAEQLADVFDVQIQFPLDLRTVKADLNARNAIGTFQRYEGLETYVISEGIKYRLEGGITNDDWVDVAASNGGKQSVTVGTATPTGGTNGDIYFRNVTGGTEVWYNNAGTWGSMGTIPTGVISASVDNTGPSGGSDGDLYYQNADDGTHVWQKVDGDWVDLGLINQIPLTDSVIRPDADTPVYDFKFRNLINPSANAPISIGNLGTTTAPSDPFQQAPVGLVKLNWSGLFTFNMKWRESPSAWVRAIEDANSGMACIEVGKEGVTLHAVPRGVEDFTAFTHEAIQVRSQPAEGTSAAATEANTPIIQFKWPSYYRWTPDTTTVNGTESWIPGDQRPLIWLHTESAVKQPDGGVLRVETNANSAGGNQIHFFKSRGAYSAKQIGNKGDRAGTINFKHWDGTKYNDSCYITSILTSSAATEDFTPATLSFFVGGYEAGDVVGSSLPKFSFSGKGVAMREGASHYKPLNRNINKIYDILSYEASGEVTGSIYITLPVQYVGANAYLSFKISIFNITGDNNGLTELWISGSSGATSGAAWSSNATTAVATSSTEKVSQVVYGSAGGLLRLKITPSSNWISPAVVISEVISMNAWNEVFFQPEWWGLEIGNTDPSGWVTVRSITPKYMQYAP